MQRKQKNAEKCSEMHSNALKCREMQKNAVKFSEMQRNAEKCRGMMINEDKCREMQICKDILTTFMTHGNVIFYILEPPAFRKYSTCWVLQ